MGKLCLVGISFITGLASLNFDAGIAASTEFEDKLVKPITPSTNTTANTNFFINSPLSLLLIRYVFHSS
ncbi:hypothetical protein ACUXCC_001368 [Cytobacillus horneckiae]